jgi:hypothetical protein
VLEETVVLALTSHHVDDELSLVGLDARTGALRWRTAIASEPADLEGGDPELAAGPDAVYLCSGRGIVASLEPETGSVLWLRRYASFHDVQRPRDPAVWGGRFGRGAPANPGASPEEAQE